MSRFSPGVFVPKSSPGGRRPALGLATLVCSLAILALVVSGASAGKVPSTQVVLGQTSTVPDPSCPGLPCQAVGSVTGFQVSNGQARSPFLVTHSGTIKSWTLTLAQPTNKQRSFFNGFFGTPPEARLAILRRVPGTNPPRYNLRSQSSAKVLTPYLGQTVKFGYLAEGRKGRHHRHHRPHLGSGLRPGTPHQRGLASQPRPRHLHQFHRHPPGRTPREALYPRHLRLPLLHGKTALHGDPGRGLEPFERLEPVSDS